MDSFYAAEKFADAIYVLATHPGPIKDRLKEASVSIAALSETDIPSIHLSDFIKIRAKLTNTHPIDNEGNFVASINAMSQSQAVDLAKDMLDLESKVSVG